MANGPQPGPPGALREAGMRGLALLASLLLGGGVILARLFSRAPATLETWVVFCLALYLALTAFVWGLDVFAFRRLPLSGIPLFLFSAAAFGVLFLLGYFVGGVAGPFLGDAASRIIPYVHIADAVFLLFAVMTIGGAAGTAFSRNIIYSAWSLLFAFLGVAGLYVFLGADFPAVAQVLIYVGGVLVLILFAIMLTKQIGEDPKLTNAHLQLPAGAALTAVTRRNAVGILMGVELILNAANVNFIAFNHFVEGPGRLTGQVFSIFVIVLAAAEAAIGLAIVLAIYQTFRTIDVEETNLLRE